jgi:hypothetical protein
MEGHFELGKGVKQVDGSFLTKVADVVGSAEDGVSFSGVMSIACSARCSIARSSSTFKLSKTSSGFQRWSQYKPRPWGKN